jgi:hypothetical protein
VNASSSPLLDELPRVVSKSWTCVCEEMWSVAFFFCPHAAFPASAFHFLPKKEKLQNFLPFLVSGLRMHAY